MNVKVSLIFILLSVIATEIVLAAVSDTTCTDNTACSAISNAECDTTNSANVCKCKDGYTETDSKCQPNLGSVCTDSDTCATANAECLNVVDGSGTTCQCSSTHKEASGNCVAKAVSDTTCTDNTACNAIANAECDTTNNANVCKCKNSYTETDSKCQPNLGSVCTDSDTCVTANAECLNVVDGSGTTCQCSSTHKEASGTCVAKGLADVCSDAADCQNVHNAACTSEKCECANGYNPDTNNVCQLVYGTACTGTEPCPGLSNSQCTDDTCQCAENFVEENKVCVLESGAASVKSMVGLMHLALMIRLLL